jgi:hypothetical protein
LVELFAGEGQRKGSSTQWLAKLEGRIVTVQRKKRLDIMDSEVDDVLMGDWKEEDG